MYKSSVKFIFILYTGLQLWLLSSHRFLSCFRNVGVDLNDQLIESLGCQTMKTPIVTFLIWFVSVRANTECWMIAVFCLNKFNAPFHSNCWIWQKDFAFQDTSPMNPSSQCETGWWAKQNKTVLSPDFSWTIDHNHRCQSNISYSGNVGEKVWRISWTLMNNFLLKGTNSETMVHSIRWSRWHEVWHKIQVLHSKWS